MNIDDTLRTSEILRRYSIRFERCIKAGRDIEARTYLPNIRKACEDLKMDWRELLGTENERFFRDTEPFMNGSVTVHEPVITAQLSEQNPQITVQKDINGSVTAQGCFCLACGNSLKGKRKGAKFCSDYCKNSHRKNTN